MERTQWLDDLRADDDALASCALQVAPPSAGSWVAPEGRQIVWLFSDEGPAAVRRSGRAILAFGACASARKPLAAVPAIT